jgi:NAD(P)-dependent dehydrogenase (short-subunit alcohol dehydrogenase family)
MEVTLDGKVAIVTGGGSGLGRGFARALAGSGAKVAVTGRRIEPLEETVALIAADGGEALAVTCDVRSRSEVEAGVQAVVDWAGGVDILVNNAGIYPPMPFLMVEEDQWIDVVDTNLNGPFRFSQTCARLMAAKGWGRIINILSPSAVMGFGMVSAYGSSKGGLASMTRNLASELAAVGITVNSLAPGASATETFVGSFTEIGVDLLAKGLPVPRACTDDDLAAALVFMASDHSGYMTGTTLFIDGGMSSTFPMSM